MSGGACERRRLLVATVDYPPIEGGISTLTRETAQALHEQGHAVTVLAPRLKNAPYEGARGPVNAPIEIDEAPHAAGSRGVAADGPRIVTFPGYGLGVFRLIPFLVVGIPLLRGHDRVLAMNIAYGGVLALIGRVFLGRPYTTFAYAYEFLKYGRIPLLGGAVRLLYRCGERVVAISAYSRQQIIAFGIPEEKVYVALPGAPDTAAVTDEAIRALRYRLALDDGPVVLSVGRLVPRKGHANLVHAFGRVLKTHPDAYLVIAGQGPEMPWISRLAHRLGIRDRVVLPGPVSDADLAVLYALCSVFALPCGEDPGGQVEGFGLVFTEANAYGKPVIGGRSGGVPDAIVHGETGILVEPDDADGLLNALLELLGNPGRARALGEAGRRRNREFLSWPRFAELSSGILPAEVSPD